MLNNIYLVIVFLAFISSLNAFRLDMPKPFKWFSFFLLFVCIVETCAVMWPRVVRNYHLHFSRENHWIYNLYLIPAYLFYLRFYYAVLYSQRIRNIIKAGAVIFGIGAVCNLLFEQGMFRLNTYSIIFAGLLIVFLSLSYFFQVFRSTVLQPLPRDPVFWISSGSFLFHLTALLGLFFIVFLNDWYGKAAYATSLIIKITSIVMYIAYTIAFICQRKA